MGIFNAGGIYLVRSPACGRREKGARQFVDNPQPTSAGEGTK